jgi:hypothetical protein
MTGRRKKKDKRFEQILTKKTWFWMVYEGLQVSRRMRGGAADTSNVPQMHMLHSAHTYQKNRFRSGDAPQGIEVPAYGSLWSCLRTVVAWPAHLLTCLQGVMQLGALCLLFMYGCQFMPNARIQTT